MRRILHSNHYPYRTQGSRTWTLLETLTELVLLCLHQPRTKDPDQFFLRCRIRTERKNPVHVTLGSGIQSSDLRWSDFSRTRFRWVSIPHFATDFSGPTRSGLDRLRRVRSMVYSTSSLRYRSTLRTGYLRDSYYLPTNVMILNPINLCVDIIDLTNLCLWHKIRSSTVWKRNFPTYYL